MVFGQKEFNARNRRRHCIKTPAFYINDRSCFRLQGKGEFIRNPGVFDVYDDAQRFKEFVHGIFRGGLALDPEREFGRCLLPLDLGNSVERLFSGGKGRAGQENSRQEKDTGSNVKK